MKEATGELNMTVVTVVAIGAVVAFFYAFVWPSIQNNIQAQNACSVGPNNTVGVSTDPDYVSCSAITGSSYECTYNITKNGNVDSRKTNCKA